MEQKEIYIETERIIIRNFKQKDAEGLLEYLSNPRVNCFAGDRLCSEEAAWAYMQYSPKDMLRYAVSLKKDDFIIGDVFALRENEDTFNVGVLGSSPRRITEQIGIKPQIAETKTVSAIFVIPLSGRIVNIVRLSRVQFVNRHIREQFCSRFECGICNLLTFCDFLRFTVYKVGL